MRKLLIISLIIVLPLSALAQSERSPHKERTEKPDIGTLIPDLTNAQKTRIDVVMRRSSKVVDGYRRQLDAVRDSIRTYMNFQEDMSSILFPLYEREAALQAEISKEYYRSKVAVDQVLSPEQYKLLNDKMKENRRRDRGHQHRSGTSPKR